MLNRIYSIYDSASGIYQRPFAGRTDGEVTRTISDIAVSDEHDIGRHPEDYTLFCLGEFNDGTGEVSGYLTPQKVATALELVALSRNVDKDNQEQLDRKISDLEKLHENIKKGSDA